MSSSISRDDEKVSSSFSTSSSSSSSPSLPALDDASGPLGSGLDISEWLERCDSALDAALESFPEVRTTAGGASVRVGRVPGSNVISMLWVQDISEEPAAVDSSSSVPDLNSPALCTNSMSKSKNKSKGNSSSKSKSKSKSKSNELDQNQDQQQAVAATEISAAAGADASIPAGTHIDCSSDARSGSGDGGGGCVRKRLFDMFLSNDMFSHAQAWDATFQGGDILAHNQHSLLPTSSIGVEKKKKKKKEHCNGEAAAANVIVGDSRKTAPLLISNPLQPESDFSSSSSSSSALVHWRFAAGPMSPRDILYLIARQRGIGGKPDTTIWGYPSVHEEWVHQYIAAPNTLRKSLGAGRVRAYNLFPTCDRVQLCNGGRTMRVAHLMTTRLGGWISPWAYNYLFRRALIAANAHEADAVAEYARSGAQGAQQHQQ